MRNKRFAPAVAGTMGRGLLFATAAASSRPHSEDRVEVFRDEESLIIVVADGAGGVAGGAAASSFVVDAVQATLANRPFDLYDVRAWSNVFAEVDADLVRTRTAGETTAIVAVVGPNGLAGVSTGDSEAWIVDRGVDPLTDGQSRARLGTGRSRSTSFHRPALEGVLVVATDGLFKAARTDAIVASCGGHDVAAIAGRLVELPRLRSGAYPDDIAIVVVANLLD